MTTRAIVVAWLLVLGCEKAEQAASGSGSGSANDTLIETFVADIDSYGQQTVPMLVKFDGDCDRFADQMLTLEPLVKTIRALGVQIEADPALHARMEERMRDARAPMMKRYEEQLKPLGLTTADVDKKEAEMKAKCAGNAKWADAQKRIGVMKRKAKPQPQ